ncbi:metallophosphoesterase [Terrilactibacillus sp. S3-3]|nr:metallophosphoesterase [Terrilactibacillus sp. S3-3]
MELFIILAVLAASALICLLMIIYMYIEAHLNRLLSYELNIEGLPAAFEKVVIFFFISDIHRRKISDRLLSELKMKPDLVIIGGDLTEEGVPFQRVENNVKKLAELGPTCFVWGNHDLQVDRDELTKVLLKYGVRILDNDTYILSRGDALFNIVGVSDVANEQDDLKRALAKSAPGIYPRF